VVLDGELTMLVGGRLSFDALQRRMVSSPSKARALVKAVPAALVAFDLLGIGGVDLRTQRWTVRCGRLEQLADRWTPPLQISPVTDDLAEAQEWFEVLPEAMGIDGLVVKAAIRCARARRVAGPLPRRCRWSDRSRAPCGPQGPALPLPLRVDAVDVGCAGERLGVVSGCGAGQPRISLVSRVNWRWPISL
jgi:hypothetical protein